MKRNSFVLLLLILTLSLSVGREDASVYAYGNAVGPKLYREALQDPACQHWVDSVMKTLTLKEQIGQLFVYTIAPQETSRNRRLLSTVVQEYGVGGLLFSGGGLPAQVRLTNQAQKEAAVPLMITFDGEWGLAMRLSNTPRFPRNRVLGCIQDNFLIYQYGQEVARQMKEMGVQVNFAPVADVNVNPRNPVINSRSFGADPQLVTDKVIAYASGLESGGVLSVCKHFPGHGDTEVDSHQALPFLPFDRSRLDSIELYPFRQAIHAGLGGMMVGHLEVPALEPQKGCPSSLSAHVVEGLLQTDFGFKGLTFTDALVMKGVSDKGDVCLKALKAGNDMLLVPPAIAQELGSILQAVESGEVSRMVIQEKCRKILTYKYALGLKRKPYVQLSGLDKRIRTQKTDELIKKLQQSAVTLLENRDFVLPLPVDSTSAKIAVVEVGTPGKVDDFTSRLDQYSKLKRFRLEEHQTVAQMKALQDQLSNYRRLVVAVSTDKVEPYQRFFNLLSGNKQLPPTVFVFFTNRKAILQLKEAVSQAPGTVLAHSDDEAVQRHVADALFGHTALDGRLSEGIGDIFPLGTGVSLQPASYGQYRASDYGFNSKTFEQIDSIALRGIKEGAYPGCQIAIWKGGVPVYERCFGTQAGKGSPSVKSNHLYDLASLSKTTGTLLALMKLYDEGRFSLADRLSQHLTWLKGTNKEKMTIREILFHQSGLPVSLSFYLQLIDEDSYKGRLFTPRRDESHSVRLGSRAWGNPRFRYKPGLTAVARDKRHSLQVCDNLWLDPSFEKEIKKLIVEAPLLSKRYRYSDVGFVLLRFLVEDLAEEPLDEFLSHNFYEPMGLTHTLYRPLTRFQTQQICPSANDRFWRKQVLRGYVHDESAAVQGGVSGNAGLFSTAHEVAILHQMLLNGGTWQGARYLSAETCRLFTTEVSAISRRGLGFDKPNTDDPENSPCAFSAPKCVYGHTGFTGTAAWVDPTNQLVYVFICNRVFPDVTNRKLIDLSIRTDLQEVIYRSLGLALPDENNKK